MGLTGSEAPGRKTNLISLLDGNVVGEINAPSTT